MDNNKKNIDLEMKKSLIKRLHRKNRGIKMSVLSSLFIPGIISLIIIGSHSDKLITSKIKLALILLLAVFVVMLISGFMMYYKNRKIRKKKRLKPIFKYIYIFIMAVYIFTCTGVLFLLYGPYVQFRDWLVTTAMATMDHKHYCTWFYNQKEIDEVFSRNFIQEPTGLTDTNLVNTEKTEPVVEYANEYEREVLEHKEGEKYKIINLEVNGCKGYLAVIYDPSEVRVTTTDQVGVRGQYVTTMAKRENAYVAINGAGFHDPNYTSSGGSPKGITIASGKIVTNNEYGRNPTGGLIGFTKDNKLVLWRDVNNAQEALRRGIRDAVSWGPYLVVNGEPAFTSGNGGWGYAARTAIGQRADGVVLLLVVDSNYNRTKGADMSDMTDIMVRYGAINASNLDGGTSSVMVVNGNLISKPINSALQNETRPIATSIIASSNK